MIKTQNLKLWIAFGAVAGLGLENKYSISVFAFALLLGLFLSSQRKLLFTPWLIVGGAVALLIFLPNLIWNVQHHWPFFEVMRNIRATGKDIAYPLVPYFTQQIVMMNPFTLPFWLGGLLFLFFSRAAESFRPFAWAFLIAVAFFFISHGKDYYSAPAYSLLLAAGAVAVEHLLASRFAPHGSASPGSESRTTSSRLESWTKFPAILKPISFAWLTVAIALPLPLVLPLLPLDAFVRFQSHSPLQPKPTERSFVGTPLPQYYADELPWQEQVAAIARVYHSLTPEEQAKTAIYCNNYGQAGAVDFFGERYGLPKAISGHQNYFLW